MPSPRTDPHQRRGGGRDDLPRVRPGLRARRVRPEAGCETGPALRTEVRLQAVLRTVHGQSENEAEEVLLGATREDGGTAREGMDR